MTLHRKDYIRFAKKATSQIMKNSYIVKPYVKESHYKRAKLVVSGFNFLLRFLDGE